MDRKELKQEYQRTPRPAGVYRIWNTDNDRVLLGSSPDAPSMLNRHRAQLRMGAHPNKPLQAEWDADGGGTFRFEILDTLSPTEDPAYDPSEDLRLLEDLWARKLELGPERRY